MNMYVECFFSIISFAMYEFCVRDYFDANANQFINVILSATSEKFKFRIKKYLLTFDIFFALSCMNNV